MEAFQHEGLWWDPSDPSRRWAGTLRFDPKSEIKLSLIAEVADPREIFSKRENYDRLFGVTPSGTAITLLRCYERNSTGVIFGTAAPRAVEIEANALIVGFHADDVDPPIVSASAVLRSLNEWRGQSGLEHDRTVARPNIAIRYTATDPIALHDDGTFRFSLRSGLTGKLGGQHADFKEETWFQIEASTPQPLSEFQDRIGAAGDFLSIACLSFCDKEELEFTAPDVDGVSRTGTFHARPVYRGREKNLSLIDMFFGFREIEKRAPALFAAWLTNAEKLDDVRSLYFAGAYGGGFLEAKLLALTQAVEAFHRRYRHGEHIDKEQFRKELLKPMLAAIPTGTDPIMRRAIEDRVRYAHELSQRDRLTALVSQYSNALKALVADPSAYVGPITNHRNAFTHFDLKARQKSRIEKERVLLFNYFLKLLLEACFLEVMGLSADEITNVCRRSEVYKQLSVRFRPWVLSPAAEPSA
jgi:hypothetical protein